MLFLRLQYYLVYMQYIASYMLEGITAKKQNFEITDENCLKVPANL